ncbi:MAG: permease-like cell division protein FtsX [Bacteroidales bacterium]|jgi:cell division transport system permease protein|nr:permease-like cell division protein FtsX [Bacteroidales bacterium]MBR4637135.1 permease-like cell division protein FtsX [Bacteroidales bacterium]MBR5920455.1 permease-like cell division protein FtsX [Bacteroidales bacterium]MBR6176125.1 permease-like cell division protein FtsX [Bacteroidales bacterium]MCR4873494.1 permease-like cell division protein FtsX [Bacteroidales bacterium]
MANYYPDTIDSITKARLRLSTFGSIFSIALTMFFIGALAFFAFFSMRYLQNLSQKIEMEVLFYSDIKEADIDALEKQIKLKPYIENSRVSSREENTRTAQQIIGSNYTEVIANPINASIIINVKPQYANSDSLNKISKELKRNPIVQDVDYPDFIVKSISNNFKKIQWVILAICLVFMIISMLLVANCIRLNIFDKRFNIKSMLLVGATPKFVRRPFVTKGLLQGVWGGIIAIILLALLLLYGNTMAPDFVDFSAMFYIVIIFAAVLLFSMLFTMIISAVSVNRYIRINDERLYL